MKQSKRAETLFEREMNSPSFRKAYRAEKKAFVLELQIAKALKEKGWTYDEFAKRVGTAKSHVCRDLKGGLERATLSRVQRMAKALHMRYLPILIPEDKADSLIPRIMHLVG